MKKVITYGTFDLFHYGHLRILERAKQLGDYLIVAVSPDEFNRIKK
jgi:glycerol-3-phosphate cytidylyltransferase